MSEITAAAQQPAQIIGGIADSMYTRFAPSNPVEGQTYVSPGCAANPLSWPLIFTNGQWHYDKTNLAGSEPPRAEANPWLQEVCKLKVQLHSKFIGGVLPCRIRATCGGFIFTPETYDIAIQAMAMQIEATLGSSVKHGDYIVTVLEPCTTSDDPLAQRGYISWKAV
jgi:hypothetical protein